MKRPVWVLIETSGEPPHVRNLRNSGKSEVGLRGGPAHCWIPPETWTRSPKRIRARARTHTERRNF